MATLGNRYYCLNRVTTRCVGGTTRKPAGNCPACGSRIYTETGLWCVFKHRGDGAYRIADAKRTFRYEPAAARYAERNADLVVRWLTESSLPATTP